MGEKNPIPRKINGVNGQVGQLMKSGGPDVTESWDSPNKTYVWFVKGDVAVGTEQGATYRLKRACSIEDVELHVKTAPTGQSLIINLNENGESLFSTKPEIDDGQTIEDGNQVFSDTDLDAGVELTMDVDQIGSGAPGADLTVLLHVKEPLT